ncbi:hypothetical protein BDV95DRAFT_475710, partial [Massariosphaeria phaeospora]
SPAFHHHAEATTAELFYDLFFVANLTTFTSALEINSSNTLTAYMGFFALLWLTWYQVSLYDVRFSADSVFERVAKAIHFGVMVGFAVIGPQWKPGQEIDDYKIYKAFGLILMVSRITLFCQYTVTLLYTKKYTKTILPLALVMGSTLVAAILYGALTPVFPNIQSVVDQATGESTPIPQMSNVYIAWYIIAISETIVTVAVSCIWRVISFKGTHMVQRMSLLTLIILGEGIIVVCKSISKIIKNEYLWSANVVGQVIASVCIIYFLYMLYFDRLQEEHFGSIKQQAWSFLHFPLHTVLVLVLQGVSLLIIWRQAIDGMQMFYTDMVLWESQTYATGLEFATAMNESAYNNVFYFIPKGVDATKEIKVAEAAFYTLESAYDALTLDATNETALAQYTDGINDLFYAGTKTIFTSLSVTTPKKKKGGDSKSIGFEALFTEYVGIFELVFMYVFIAGGLSLIITTVLGFISLPVHQRTLSQRIRLGLNAFFGVGLCLISLLRYNMDLKVNYMSSDWMIPTICMIYFICVVINHVSLPK